MNPFSKLHLVIQNKIRSLFSVVLLLATMMASGQGLEGIYVERYYQTDAADETDALDNGAVAPLPVGSTCYRVYVDMAEGYKFIQIFGNADHPLTVNTTTAFFNDPNYGVMLNPATISTNNIRKHTAMIDSWFTTGGTANSKVGVIESEDTDGTLGNQHGVLANDPGGCYGIPITGVNGQDGMIPSSATTYLVPNQLGLGSALQALDQTTLNSITIDNGAIAALGGIVGPSASNMVLIGQFTTDGDLTFALNVQIVNVGTGDAENYVSSNPSMEEYTHPTLIRTTNVAPVVSISYPLNNATVSTGASIDITANVIDANGTSPLVEFYLDNTLIGTDNTAPYSVPYVATGGSHTVYAIASDTDCASTTSVSITFNVANNEPPVVSLTAPSSAIAGTTVNFTASASDPDGSVTQVEFFVNNISIGIDNTSPYDIDYLVSAGTGQSVKAVATDNLGTSTTSNIVIMDVLVNEPPTVEITSPANGSTFIAPEEVSISAAASDADGSIVSVEFFVDNVSIGIDSESPYTTPWISSPGEYSLTSIATDNLGAQTTSEAITINIADPNGLQYYVDNITLPCNEPTVCLPFGISITSPVDNIIGYDIVLTYDELMLQPSGVVYMTDNLANASIVDATATIVTDGVLAVTIVFDGTEPLAEFQGYGDLFCAEFNRLPGLLPTGSTSVSVSSITESYISQTLNAEGSAGGVTSTIADDFQANLVFWSDNSPIQYNSAAPNEFLITNIYGSYNNNITNPGNPGQPDLNGDFHHSLYDGNAIQIQRDIDNNSSVQTMINAADVVLCKSLLLNGEFTPSIYEILSMDVNLDGIISAGDITQINQRATSAIGEYMQAWNYDDQGNSNGQPSKDWIFIDQARIDNNPAYTISALFPENDNTGYSSSLVPVVPFNLDLPVADFDPDGNTCATIGTETYQAILLGDVSASYANIEDLLQPITTDTLLLDLSNSLYTNDGTNVIIEIPVVAHVNSGDINAADLWLKYDTDRLTFQSVTSGTTTTAFAHYNSFTDYLRASVSTASMFDYLIDGSQIATLNFLVLDACNPIDANDFTDFEVMLNGQIAQVRISEPAELVLPAIEIIGQAPYCEDNEIAMSYPETILGQQATSYTWQFADSGTGTGSPVNALFEESGNFNVTVTAVTSSGCEYSVQTQVSITPSPEADFDYVFNNVTNEVTFTNTSLFSEGTIVSYEWVFGDGGNADVENPVHTYAASGDYDVTLTATSAEGCPGISIQTINIPVNVIENANTLNMLSIFPNPAMDQLQIVSPGMLHYTITDARGRIVKTGTPERYTKMEQISIQHLPGGEYTVTVYHAGRIMIEKLIIIK